MLTPGQRQLVAFSRNIPFLQHRSSTHPVLNSTNKTASKFVDEKIISKVDMAALAGHGVNMNHPCVRIYAKDEVPANRKFLVASAIWFSTRRFLDVCLYNPAAVIHCLTYSCRTCHLRRWQQPRKIIRLAGGALWGRRLTPTNS